MIVTENLLLYSVLALLSLLPAAIAVYRRDAARDNVFWAATGLAVFGPVLWCATQFSGVWQTGL